MPAKSTGLMRESDRKAVTSKTRWGTQGPIWLRNVGRLRAQGWVKEQPCAWVWMDVTRWGRVRELGQPGPGVWDHLGCRGTAVKAGMAFSHPYPPAVPAAHRAQSCAVSRDGTFPSAARKAAPATMPAVPPGPPELSLTALRVEVACFCQGAATSIM